MDGPEVIVVPTGSANLASILAGMRRIGAAPRVSDDVGEVASARRVVLPGVGAFGAAMAKLSVGKLTDVLAERVREGRPTLAVCLGLQLLCATSEETEGAVGLGVLPSRVERFSHEVRAPQMGWNMVEAQSGCRFLETGYAYFANSYCLRDEPEGWSVACTEHGGQFVSALERGAVLACQFHPELSGPWGLGLLARWLAIGETEGDTC